MLCIMNYAVPFFRLLYNNGDLKDFPSEVSPEPGIYVCTFVENKVVRGLILNKHKK